MSAEDQSGWDWKAIGKSLADIGLPLLGTAIMGPAGAAVGSLIASALGSGTSPAEVAAAVTQAASGANPDAILKLRELELNHQAKLFSMTVDAETRQIEAVNKSMQAESQSEHWAQWSWRPYVGFCFGSAWIGTYFILPLLKIPAPVIPTEGWLAIGAVLGVASWFRGKQKENS